MYGVYYSLSLFRYWKAVIERGKEKDSNLGAIMYSLLIEFSLAPNWVLGLGAVGSDTLSLLLGKIPGF